MPSFTVYVTGGVEWFYSTLNAVAMFFNDGDLIREVALMGGMIAVATGAWHWIQKQLGSNMLKTNSWVEHGIAMAIAVAIGFAPARVVIQDVYDDMSAAPVDNVPLIFAVPAAIFSGISYNVFKAVDTTFASTSGSYMSISDQGFATPLSLLFAMRGGLESTAPDLAKSLTNYMLDCSRNSAINSRGVATDTNLFQYLMDNGRDQGLTQTYIQSGGGGTVTALNNAASVSCAQAKSLLEQRFDVFETGGKMSDVNRLINFNVRQAAHGRATSSTTYDYSQYENAFNQLLGFTGQTAQQFMRTGLIRNLVNDTYRCANESYSQAQFVNCTQVQHDAMEAYKVDATAAGSLFTKTMFPAMILLQMMFFAFGVIIFLYGLIRGAGVVTYLGKYMLFGAWVFSWLPFVAIINAFIQWMVIEKISALPKAGLTSESYRTYMYDVLSTNLATASDMLAATPLLTLGLLTGSAYAVAGIANRLSARDYVDESQAAPRTGTVQPMVQTAPEHQGNMATGVQSAGFVPRQFSADFSSRETERSAYEQMAEKQWSQLRAAGDVHSRMVTDLSGQTISNGDTVTNALSRDRVSSVGYRAVDSYAEGNGMSTKDANAVKAALDANLGVGASTPGGTGPSASIGIGAKGEASYQAEANFSADQKNALEKARSQMLSYTNKAVAQASDAVTTLGGTTGADTRQSIDRYEQSRGEAEKAQESYTRTKELGNSVGGSVSISSEKLGSMIEADAQKGSGGYSWARNIHDRYQQLSGDIGASKAEALRSEQWNALTGNGSSYLRGADSMAELAVIQKFDQGFYNNRIAEATGLTAVSGNAAENSGVGSRAAGVVVSNDVGGADGALQGLPKATGMRSAQGRIISASDNAVDNGNIMGGRGANDQALEGQFNQLGGKARTVGNSSAAVENAAGHMADKTSRMFHQKHNEPLANTLDRALPEQVYGNRSGQDPKQLSSRAAKGVREAENSAADAAKNGGLNVDMSGSTDVPKI